MNEITVVCWKYGSKYPASHVNTLASMLSRHLHCPYHIVCITDDPAGLDSHIYIHTIQYTGGILNLRRLWLFSEEARVLGPHLLQLDLDIVITGDITSLATDPAPFRIYKYTAPNSLGYALNPSVMRLDSGAHIPLWYDYITNPDELFNFSRRARCSGSDQSIITYHFTTQDDPRNRSRMIQCPVWTAEDGILWYRELIRERGQMDAPLPAEARIVSFHGSADPGKYVEKWPWVKEHWR